MDKQNFVVKKMTRNELDTAIAWADEEGWNPGYFDAESFYSADPDGFLIGLLNDEPIASISVVRYGDSYGFLGFYIVKPAYRDMGYGLQLWKAGLAYLEGRNIGLDGVVEQQENYKKSGFHFAYNNIRFQGISDGQCLENKDVVDLTDLPFGKVNDFDRKFFPSERANFLKHWINQKSSKALAVVKDNELAGYGVIRPCRNGYKIGPLFAETVSLAETLFLSLISTLKKNEVFFLDVPQVNLSAIKLADNYQMKVVFETARMYTKDLPELPLDKIYGVTSFELG